MVSELSGIVKAKTLRSWNLSANNLEESVAFWRDLLGAEERNRHQVGGVDVARLSLGGFGIGLFDASAGERPGVPHHTVGIEGPDDRIELRHEARSRAGFARGAVLAAEWLEGRSGVFTMSDVMKELLGDDSLIAP